MRELPRADRLRTTPRLRGELKWLGWYFGLAYALSWAWLVPLVLAGGSIAAGRGWPTHLPALLGPALAAVVVTSWRDGRSGLVALARRVVLVRVAPRWWLVALSPLLLLPVVLGVETLADQPLPAIGDFAVFTGVPAAWGVLGVVATMLVVNGFGEETGWRGFALPALQREHSPLSSTAILAVLWAGWHAPMFVVVESFRGFTALTVVGWFVGIFSGAVVLTWLANRSGGSIALVAIWHTGYNVVSGTRAAEGLLAATSTTLVIILAVVLLVAELRSVRHDRSVLGPRVPPP